MSRRMRTSRLLWIAGFAALLGAFLCDTLPGQRRLARVDLAPARTTPRLLPSRPTKTRPQRRIRRPKHQGRRGVLTPRRVTFWGAARAPTSATNNRRCGGSRRSGNNRPSVGSCDSIDGRIPHNATESKHLEQAEQLIASGHWDQALELLEIVLAHSDHATIRTPDGRPGLVAWEANRLLGRLPAAQLETYRLRHEAQARELDRAAAALAIGTR